MTIALLHGLGKWEYGYGHKLQARPHYAVLCVFGKSQAGGAEWFARSSRSVLSRGKSLVLRLRSLIYVALRAFTGCH